MWDEAVKCTIKWEGKSVGKHDRDDGFKRQGLSAVIKIFRYLKENMNTMRNDVKKKKTTDIKNKKV